MGAALRVLCAPLGQALCTTIMSTLGLGLFECMSTGRDEGRNVPLHSAADHIRAVVWWIYSLRQRRHRSDCVINIVRCL